MKGRKIICAKMARSMFQTKKSQAMTEYIILTTIVVMMFIAAYSLDFIKSKSEAKAADESGMILTETVIQKYSNRIVNNISLPIP